MVILFFFFFFYPKRNKDVQVNFDPGFGEQPIKTYCQTWNQVIAVCILIVHYE